MEDLISNLINKRYIDCMTMYDIAKVKKKVLKNTISDLKELDNLIDLHKYIPNISNPIIDTNKLISNLEKELKDLEDDITIMGFFELHSTFTIDVTFPELNIDDLNTIRPGYTPYAKFIDIWRNDALNRLFNKGLTREDILNRINSICQKINRD